jgi:hypothetical protein
VPWIPPAGLEAVLERRVRDPVGPLFVAVLLGGCIVGFGSRCFGCPLMVVFGIWGPPVCREGTLPGEYPAPGEETLER